MLKISLFILRYALTAFLAVWVVEKFLEPETTQAIWGRFYGFDDLSLNASYIIGGVQAVALLAFVTGFAKFFSYGFWLVCHGYGTIMSYGPLLNPYEGSNHLFWAAVPVLAAFLALFLLRNEDTILAFHEDIPHPD